MHCAKCIISWCGNFAVKIVPAEFLETTFTQTFHARKLDEIWVLSAVKVAAVIYFNFLEKYQCKEAENITISVGKVTALKLWYGYVN